MYQLEGKTGYAFVCWRTLLLGDIAINLYFIRLCEKSVKCEEHTNKNPTYLRGFSEAKGSEKYLVSECVYMS